MHCGKRSATDRLSEPLRLQRPIDREVVYTETRRAVGRYAITVSVISF